MNILQFRNAIVRKPCKNMVNGLTSANLGKPDFKLACEQHQKYIEALKLCGLEVDILEANENYPDSTFIEDIALLTPHCAIITNPGAPSRKEEAKDIIKTIEKYYTRIEFIREPGTIEAGDIMMVGDHYYIGLSERTNEAGANQMISILEKHEMTGSTIRLKKLLHLKTGIAYLENNNMLVCGELISHPEFQQFNKIIIPENESYAANCIWVNGSVVMPSGYPQAKKIITSYGYKTIDVDLSEFQKLDGGASCLSLRF